MLLIAILASFCTSGRPSRSRNMRPPPGLQAMGQAPPGWEYIAMAQAPDFGYMPQAPVFEYMPQGPGFGHMPQTPGFGYMPQTPSTPPGIPHFLHEEGHASAMQSYVQQYQRVVEDGLRRLQNTPLPNLSQPMRVEITPSMLENQPTGAETPLVSESQPVGVETTPTSNAPAAMPRRRPTEDLVAPDPTMPDRVFFWPTDIRRFFTSDKQYVSPPFYSQDNEFKVMIVPPSDKDEGKGKNSLRSAKGKFRIKVKCEHIADDADHTASFIILVERRTSNGWEEMNQASTLHMDLELSAPQELNEIFDLNMEGKESIGVRISIHRA